MAEFEYKQAMVSTSGPLDQWPAKVGDMPYNWQTLLANLGGQGWELASMAPVPDRERLLAIFKRPA